MEKKDLFWKDLLALKVMAKNGDYVAMGGAVVYRGESGQFFPYTHIVFRMMGFGNGLTPDQVPSRLAAQDRYGDEIDLLFEKVDESYWVGKSGSEAGSYLQKAAVVPMGVALTWLIKDLAPKIFGPKPNLAN